jgi:hypothetical protein
MFVNGPFLTFQYLSMDVGNDGVCVHDIVTNVRNGYVGIHGQLGLRGIIGDGQVKMTERTLKT